jgi:signal transduction histidine kinase/DNA-binding response OmpR family regulator
VSGPGRLGPRPPGVGEPGIGGLTVARARAPRRDARAAVGRVPGVFCGSRRGTCSLRFRPLEGLERGSRRSDDQAKPLVRSRDSDLASRILVVDDEPSSLQALAAIVAPLGQNVVLASSGEEALRRAIDDDYALFIIDVQMPAMDGIATLELLRQRPGHRSVPVVFVSDLGADRATVARGYAAGAADFLTKPYDHVVVTAKVRTFVELARRARVIHTQRAALRMLEQREPSPSRASTDGDLADSVPLLLWTSDATGHLQCGNRRLDELSGGSRDFSSVVAPEDVGRFVDGWNAAIASGEEWEAELRIGSVVEGWRVHLVRVIPHRDASGAITSWVGTSTDIDARARAERSLRMLSDVSRRLGSTLEHPAEIEAVVRGVLPVLGDLAILEVAAGGAAPEKIKLSAGARPVSLLDDPRFDREPALVRYSGRPEVHRDICAELRSALPGRGVESVRFLGELGITSYMCLPLFARDRTVGTLTLMRGERGAPYAPGEVALAEELARRIAVAVDNAQVHETTERRREELEVANSAKDVFLATLSHELRTPLNAIVGWIDLMRSGQLVPDDLRRAIETIDRNAHALSHLVADLLDVSRIVTGSLKLDSRIVDLASVVGAAVEAARPQCAAKRIALDVSIERVGGVQGDAGRLRQVLGNLLSNAIKFTPAEGTITVRVTREGTEGKVLVADSGEGIAPELLPHVFERFRQAEDAKARGLGLGLAIVSHLVESHGGTAVAASDGRGKGASFTVVLPIAADDTLAAEGDEAARASSPPSESPRLVGVHALVVEDDPDGNELITSILERYGARVTSVTTAGAAVEALDAERPDIIVSDIGLPDRDGIELIKIVRSRACGETIPAIALTAYASRQDAVRVLGAGFDAHVAKPVRPGALGRTVARLVAVDRDEQATAWQQEA